MEKLTEKVDVIGDMMFHELPERYWLEVTGSALEPTFSNGCKVRCERDARPENGDFATAYILQRGELKQVLGKVVLGLPGRFELPFEGHPGDTVRPIVVMAQSNPARQWTIPAEKLMGLHKVSAIAGEL